MVDEAISIDGRLSEGDVRRLARLTRGSTVGPTATYYAGVTAPVISAAMAIFSKQAFQALELPSWWVFFLSACLAALAGIAWYLIFMRWSYRHSYGRGSELTDPTGLTIDADAITLRRGHIETRIGWPAVSAIHDRRGYIAIVADGADAIVIPDRWFAGDRQARSELLARLFARGSA